MKGKLRMVQKVGGEKKREQYGEGRMEEKRKRETIKWNKRLRKWREELQSQGNGEGS